MTTTEQLLAAVLANPGDDELRKVYGDALVEVGHPQGELIALQYARLEGRATPDTLERERLLLERHGPDMLGPLIAVVDRYKIERGFLHSCNVPSYRPAYNVQRVVGHPLWATVEELAAPPAIYLDPSTRALRSLSTDYGDTAGVVELCTGTSRPLARLTVHAYSASLMAALVDAPALPQLRELQFANVRRPQDVEALAPGSLRERLARLEIGVYDGALGEWVTALAAYRPAAVVVVQHLSLGTWRCRLQLERDGAGSFARAHLHCVYRHWISGPIDLAPLGSIGELSVVVASGTYRTPLQPAVDELATAVARFPRSSFRVE